MNITAFAETIQKDTRTEKIAEVVTKFYQNKDNNGDYDLSKYFSTDILTYLTDKINTARYVDELYGFERYDYSVKVRLVECEIKGSIMNVGFAVETVCNYSKTKDNPSTIGEYVIIIYDLENNVIIDFYTPYNYYDEAIRPESNKENILTTNGYRINRNTEAKQISLINDIDTVNKQQSEQLDKNETISYHLNSRANVGINRTAVVNYARNNFNKVTPASGIPGVTYRDFSDVGILNYDCTNFVSHALAAGGAGRYDRGNSGITDNNEWYFRNIDNRAQAWSSVTKLYTYLTTNTVYGTAAGISSSYVNYDGYWETGYVMQTTPVNSSTYSHSLIITDKEVIANRAYAYVTGRTGDLFYNDNAPVEQMNPNRLKRVIYVYNNG